MALPIYTQDQVNKNLDTGTDNSTITTTQSQTVSQQTEPGPIAYRPPASDIQTFDDGSSIQTFDDGSTLATGTDGKLSATNATDAYAPLNSRPAAAASNDDAGQSNTVTGTTIGVNFATDPSGPITPRANILDQYASYTYSLSWYMLTPDQFTKMKNTSKLNTNEWSLLVQSGGATAQQTATTQSGVDAGSRTTNSGVTTGLTTQATTGRNKYFSLDYYLDDLEIESMLQERSLQSTKIAFKITEPNGITLMANLNNAARDLLKQDAAALQKVQYVMVIRFYGWDAQGNLVQKLSPSAGTPGGLTSGISSAAVKYIPFSIAELKFKAANKAVEYYVTGYPPDYAYGQTTALGSVPNTIELTGETVGDILIGSAANPSPKNTPTVTPAVTSGPTVRSLTAAAGTDVNLITDQGIAFGGGGL